MIGVNTYIGNLNETLDQAVESRMAMVWTALPGIIQSFDSQAMTCEVQPSIQGKVRAEDGTITLVNLPLLLDCPVVFPRGGGCTLTFPIKPGDECLVVFSDRAIDLWWQSGGVQAPVETRMHDLSDGFVLPGCFSQPNVLSGVSTSTVQLRTDDGQAYFELNPSSHDFNLITPGNFTAQVKNFTIDCEAFALDCQTMTVNASASVTITAPNIALNGQISAGGSSGAQASFTGGIEATGDIKAGDISLKGHTHSGVQPGDGNSGGPQ